MSGVNYSIPSMAEIRNIPWNGFNVVSLFSGCGGSSLGYRRAGYRVLLASEFVEAAAECYKQNKSNYTKIDTRDIRNVSASDILNLISMDIGELDLLDGSPPCASFSTQGSGSKKWGKKNNYSDTVQRTDDLFYEFIRLVNGLQPKVFIAENVKGLVSGKSKGYFLEFLTNMKKAGYTVSAKLLDAQWLGVPQRRARIIFIGVRSDLKVNPVFPKPLQSRISIADAFKGINSAPEPESYIKEHLIMGKVWNRLRPGERYEKFLSHRKLHPDEPSDCVNATPSLMHFSERRYLSIAELKRICSFPDDFILTGTYRNQYERLGRAVPPIMMSHISACVRDGILGDA